MYVLRRKYDLRVNETEPAIPIYQKKFFKFGLLEREIGTKEKLSTQGVKCFLQIEIFR